MVKFFNQISSSAYGMLAELWKISYNKSYGTIYCTKRRLGVAPTKIVGWAFSPTEPNKVVNKSGG